MSSAMAPTFSSISLAINPKLPLFSSKLSPRRRHTLKPVMCSQHLHWVSVDRDVKSHILTSLSTDIHPEVSEPMRHIISSAPPTVTPAICLASCELIGGEREHAMTTACCMQLIHIALHAHGRLLGPNRSQPGKFPDGIELMTGDGILALAYEFMSRSEGVNPERVVRAIIEITSGTGPKGALEVEAEKVRRGDRVKENRKEGRLSACAAACGAIMGGGSKEEVERMRRLGLYAGMMCAGSNDDDDRNTFLSLARLELQGFEQEKSIAMKGIMDALTTNITTPSFSV